MKCRITIFWGILLIGVLGCKSADKPLEPRHPVLPSPNDSNPHVMLLDPKTGLRTGNLWHNIVGDFQIPSHTAHPQVQAQIQWFVKNPDYLIRTTQRAVPYMHLIHEQVKNRNLPAEVVMLPMIESAYYPFSYSGAGAAGLWQLMPGTASDLGVKRSRWYDGRHDIFVSTHAALDYLVQLHKTFKGDWLLAIAAYDAGPGRVQAAINRNQQEGRPTDFWSLDLPAETRAYVPRFLALASIVQNPGAYSVKLPAIDDQPYLARVDVGAQIHLKEAARLANMSFEDLKHLNPSYHTHLLLPLDKVDIFRKNLAQATRSTQTTWGHHKMQPGETLASVAQQYHTTVAALEKVNINRTGVLLVPTVREVIGATSDTDNATPKPIRLTKHLKKQSGYYRVYYGDTLPSVAKKFGISVRQIQQWNRLMNGEQIWPGQMLVVGANAVRPYFANATGKLG